MTQILIPAVGDDGALYKIEKLEAHRRGVKHLAVSVFLLAGDWRHSGAMLLQRRALGKYHCGGMWANACCTHPHWGESFADCAHRRLTEELGVYVDLVDVGETEYRADVGGGLIEHEQVRLFVGRVPLDLALNLNPDEVMQTRWAGADELRAEMAARPEIYTPWLRLYLSGGLVAPDVLSAPFARRPRRSVAV